MTDFGLGASELGTAGTSELARRGAVMHGAGLRFALVTAAALLIVHALAYFHHEYSHSTTAWLLGFKASPFAINYGKKPAGGFKHIAAAAD